jgi:preprotein translocase subunit SecD
MKTIIYALIAIFIIGILATGFINKSNTSQRILVQSTDSKISSAMLSKSAEIITNRLKIFSSEKFQLAMVPDKNQIQVLFADSWDMKTVEKLITQKGAIEFYETYSYKCLLELLKGDSSLLSLLHDKALNDSYAKIGCTSFEKVSRVNESLNSVRLSQKCKFVWSNLFDDSDVCLYALKIENGNGVLLRGTDIESFKLGSTAGKKDEIEIKFKKPAIKLWSELTKRNLNNSIAIVLDNKVIVAPTVRSEIDGGNCQITGDFNQTQLRTIAAIGGNEELPVSFNVVK